MALKRMVLLDVCDIEDGDGPLSGMGDSGMRRHLREALVAMKEVTAIMEL